MKWFKKHRERKAETQTQQTKNELREFVYLDEVSVTSLLSARTGAIPHEFTDSAGSAYKGDVNGQIEVGIGPLKSRVGSRYESSRSANSQVVSKATVQALVGRLFELEEGDLFMRANLPTSTRPPKKDTGRVLAEELDPAEKYWVSSRPSA
ncbi:hypothetical protein OG205_04690 [Lentzea sp. NBC_00516]|uniref:DUF6414 family protein n=1 Tax=Lentzea sp. NBC_00516 TaxID=2903582 RepID=UPI002E801F3F|nr:hypothetical protein [Lentzea sp. NBC_00516]WUD26311.1 hypothetical protein OG205_04690 [Lentzea sp. NBC_00516]